MLATLDESIQLQNKRPTYRTRMLTKILSNNFLFFLTRLRRRWRKTPPKSTASPTWGAWRSNTRLRGPRPARRSSSPSRTLVSEVHSVSIISWSDLIWLVGFFLNGICHITFYLKAYFWVLRNTKLLIFSSLPVSFRKYNRLAVVSPAPLTSFEFIVMS